MFEFDAEMNVVIINGAFVHENMSMILSVLSPSLSLFFFYGRLKYNWACCLV